MIFMTFVKRHIILLLLSVTFTFSFSQKSYGQMGPQVGLKGFVELTAGTGLGLNGSGRAMISGTYGYQINPVVFTGAGFGYDFNNKLKLVFADARFTMNKKISPFADIKLGLNIDNSRMYFAPTFGCRYGLDNGMALNFGVGIDYTMTWHCEQEPYYDNLYKENRILCKKVLNDDYSLCLKASVEF